MSNLTNYIKYDLHNADILLSCAIKNAVAALLSQELSEVNLGRNITPGTLIDNIDHLSYDFDLQSSGIWTMLFHLSNDITIHADCDLYDDTILYKI